jgi:Putative sensor
MFDAPKQHRPEMLWTDLLAGRTYLNIAYLLLGFPLGLMYFVVLVTGIALGLGLSITLLGIPVLLSVVGFVWSFVWFERQAAAAVLGLELAPRTPSSTRDVPRTPSGTVHSDQPSFARSWNTLRAYISSGVFWRGLAHLLIRLPLGLLCFTVVIVLVSVSAALIGAPLFYNHADWSYGWPSWQPNFIQAICLSAVGIGVGLISVRLMNLLAESVAKLTYHWLDDSRVLEPQARNNPEPQIITDLEPGSRNPDPHNDERER